MPGNDLEKKSENTSIEACTQTDEENGKLISLNFILFIF